MNANLDLNDDYNMDWEKENDLTDILDAHKVECPYNNNCFNEDGGCEYLNQCHPSR